MPVDINWITVIVSCLGSLGTGVVVIAGALVAWGRLRERVRNHEESQKKSNGKIDAQKEKDSELQAQLRAVESRCEARKEQFRRNDADHEEIFRRLVTLETGMAALPGKIADRMDTQFKEWRKTWSRDVKAIIYEVDSEKKAKEKRRTGD